MPGDRIGTIRQVRTGIGTYVKGGHIYACLLGKLTLTQQVEENENINENDDDENDNDNVLPDDNNENDDHNTSSSSLYTCSVVNNNNNNSISKSPATDQVLRVGQRVVGRISRITPQNAVVEIRVAEGVGPLRLPYYEGAIRLDDVRNTTTKEENVTTITPVVLADCFRPGDLVACRVISMGDSRRYFLTTAETELGVVRAERKKGVAMIPVSWKEMECPETGVREPRKCAKPLLL